jgi:hypothetical protein
MNRAGVTLLWVIWVVGAIVIYRACPSTAGFSAVLVTVWWNTWPSVVGLGLILTVLVLAAWLLPRMRR